jgi:hypothetical protein
LILGRSWLTFGPTRVDQGTEFVSRDLIRFSGRNRNVEDHARTGIDGRVLLIGRFETPVASGRCHCSIRVGHAHFLAFTARATRLVGVALARAPTGFRSLLR